MDDKAEKNGRAYYQNYEECGIIYGEGQQPRFRPEVGLFLDWIPAGSKVVDLGCGDGSIGERIIKERQATVSGVEIDPAGVVEAKKRGVDAQAGDLDTGLPYADNSFDIAIINVTLHMVFRPRYVLEEALRIAPRVIVTFPNLGFWVYRLELLLFGRFPKHSLYGYHWYDTRHIHMFSLADLQDLAQVLKVNVEGRRYVGVRNRKESRIARVAPNLWARTAVVQLSRKPA